MNNWLDGIFAIADPPRLTLAMSVYPLPQFPLNPNTGHYEFYVVISYTPFQFLGGTPKHPAHYLEPATYANADPILVNHYPLAAAPDPAPDPHFDSVRINPNGTGDYFITILSAAYPTLTSIPTPGSYIPWYGRIGGRFSGYFPNGWSYLAAIGGVVALFSARGVFGSGLWWSTGMSPRTVTSHVSAYINCRSYGWPSTPGTPCRVSGAARVHAR